MNEGMRWAIQQQQAREREQREFWQLVRMADLRTQAVNDKLEHGEVEDEERE